MEKIVNLELEPYKFMDRVESNVNLIYYNSSMILYQPVSKQVSFEGITGFQMCTVPGKWGFFGQYIIQKDVFCSFWVTLLMNFLKLSLVPS